MPPTGDRRPPARLRSTLLVAVLLAAVSAAAVSGSAILRALQGAPDQSSSSAPLAPSAPQSTGNAHRGDPAPRDASAEQAELAGVAALADPGWVTRVATASGIPERALLAYAGADLYARDHYDCAVGWNSLAAIGHVETDHGRLQGGRIDPDGFARPRILGIALDGVRTAAIPDTDGGALDGDAAWDRAVGPMQFIPQTWEQWAVDGNGDGAADIDSIDDAALTAARYLCQAQGTLEPAEAWDAAVRSYNDNVAYRNRVADSAAHYGAVGAETE